MRNEVGVVIPTFERPNQTIRAVQSVLNQSTKPTRILVIDDGSGEEVRKRLRSELESLGVEFLELEHSGHPGKVRKIGVERIDTEWVAFLDSDDEWLPQKIEKQLSQLQESGNSAICTNAVFLHNNQNYFSERIKKRTFKMSDLIKSNPIICSSAMVSRKLLLEVGSFVDADSARGAEDYATWLRIAELTDWEYLSDPLVLYSDLSSDSLRIEIEQLGTPPNLLGLKDFSAWIYPRKSIYLEVSMLKSKIVKKMSR